jgi:hypothetical protein
MTVAGASHPSGEVVPERIALVDLLDRVLATGVVVSGEVILSIADVDLVHVSLRALISSVRAGEGGPLGEVAGLTGTAPEPGER